MSDYTKYDIRKLQDTLAKKDTQLATANEQIVALIEMARRHGLTPQSSKSPLGYLSSLIAEQKKEIEKLQQELKGERECSWRQMLEIRNIEKPCHKCSGFGVITYGDTSTWRGGIGGQSTTADICDHCWGSGDDIRHWMNLKTLFISKIKKSTTTYNLEK